MGRLTFAADIDTSTFSRKVMQIEDSIKHISQQAANSGSILDKSFQKAGQSASFLGNDVLSLQRNLIGLASAATLGRLGQEVINIRGEFQQLNIAFEVMLGSKEKADKLMAQQIAFAQKTPYTLTDVATNTKQLLAMGIAQEKVMRTMQDLGNVAAGVSVPIARVAVNYGQVATMGKLMGRELRDFNMAGIPLQEELAKNLGKAKDEIAGMVEAGQIGFPMVEKAFQTMSGEGGKFYNLMERQNKSVTGQVSNLTDKIQVMFNEIGKSNEGLIYGGISGLSTVVANYQDVLDILKVLIATYGAYRAALMLTTAAQNISTISTMAQEWLVMGKALGFATANQMLFNNSVLLNPYVAAAVGITALITALVVFSEKAKTAEDYIKDLNDSMEQIGKQIELESTIAKFEELDKKVIKTKEEQDELNKTIQKLSLIFPGAITETDKYGKAVGLVTDELLKQNKALRDNLKAVNESQVIGGQKELNELISERARKLQEINSGKYTYSLGNGQSATAELTPDEIQSRRDQVIAMSATIDQLGAKIQQSNEKLYELTSIDASIALKPYEQLFKVVGEYTKKQALDAKAQLVGLLGENLGGRAESQIINQINELDEYIKKLKTTAQQEKEWQTELIAAQAKLNEIKKAGYESIDIAKEKADQEAIIKTLEDKLDIKHKEKKAVDELKQAHEDLEKAVIAGNDPQIKALAHKINLLEQERKIIQDKIALELYLDKSSEARDSKIAEQFNKQHALLGYTFQGSSKVAPISPTIGSTTMLNGVMYEVTEIDKKFGAVWKKSTLEVGKLNAFAKGKVKEAADLQKDLDEEKKKRQEETTQQALQFMDNMLAKYGEQLGMTEEEAGLISSLARGDYFAAAFNMIGVVSKFFKAEKDGVTEYYENLDTQTKKLIESLDLVNKSLLNIGTSGAFRSFNVLSAELVKLKNDAARLNEQLIITGRRGSDTQGATTNGTRTDEIIRARTILDLSKQTADLYAEIEKLTYKLLDPNLTEEQRTQIKALLNSYNSIIDSINASVKEITGTTIQDLSNSLIDVFLSGEDAAAKWGETVDGIIKNVIKKQLVAQLLTMPITEAINTLINDSSDGLTPDKALKFKNSMDVLYSTTKPIVDLVNGSFKASGIDLIDSSAKSSSAATGISSQLTEETGSLLAGLITGTRIDIKSIQETSINMLELMDQSLSVLGTIASNTKHNSVLPEIRDELKTMNQNFKNLG